jgi:hypothetical protein
MDQAIVQQAQAFISEKTPNATCPMCGGTHWHPLPDLVGFMAIAITHAHDTAHAKEILDEFGDDISNFEILRCEAVGFFCAHCRYLRLHV